MVLRICVATSLNLLINMLGLSQELYVILETSCCKWTMIFLWVVSLIRPSMLSTSLSVNLVTWEVYFILWSSVSSCIALQDFWLRKMTLVPLCLYDGKSQLLYTKLHPCTMQCASLFHLAQSLTHFMLVRCNRSEILWSMICGKMFHLRQDHQ